MEPAMLRPAEPDPQPDGTPAEGQPEKDAAFAWRIARLLLEAAVRSVSAVDDALTPAPVRRVAVDVVIGAGAIAGEGTGRVAEHVAVVGRRIGARARGLPRREPPLDPLEALSGLAERGRRERAAAAVDIDRLVAALVPAVTAALLDRLDLTALV